MKLLEHEAKALLRQAGLNAPAGEVATTADAVGEIAGRLVPVAVKAQVGIGGRGKAGGIKLADTPAAAREAAEGMLGTELRGELVESVLVEQKLDIAHERYLAIDTSTGCPVVL
ncbi:MAG: succinyl-CoA synthetase beta subunit [Candidatus Poriferisodalaceae bacterium]|jgi:succinyl-CoA synthetase beta subunit